MRDPFALRGACDSHESARQPLLSDAWCHGLLEEGCALQGSHSLRGEPHRMDHGERVVLSRIVAESTHRTRVHAHVSHSDLPDERLRNLHAHQVPKRVIPCRRAQLADDFRIHSTLCKHQPELELKP